MMVQDFAVMGKADEIYILPNKNCDAVNKAIEE